MHLRVICSHAFSHLNASSKKLLESLLGTNHDFTQNVKQTPDNHPLDEKTLNPSMQPKKAYYATSELE